jgi:hypothetical protein
MFRKKKRNLVTLNNLSERFGGLSLSIANNPMGRRTEKNLEAVLTRVPDLHSLNFSRILSLGSGSLLACISSLDRQVLLMTARIWMYTLH